MELDISKVVRIDSLVEKPIYDRYSSTLRSTCKSITNEETIPNIEAIKVITDLTEDLEKMPTKDVCEKYTEVIPIVIEHCEGTIFDDVDIKLIETEEELKKYLSDVIVRFDTSPKYYTKEDYASLLRVLYRSLLHIYKDEAHDLVTEWSDPLRDDAVPSEKLVKETIDSLINEVDQSIYETNLTVLKEIQDRINADLNLQDNLNELVSNLSQEISDRLSDVQEINEHISNIESLIPREATSSNLLADKEFVHDLIATNAANFRGDWANWNSVPTDPLYYPEDYTGNKKPNTNDYLIIQNATDYDPSNTGIWRFVYKGNWDTLGKSGWEPQYRVELAFTPELLNAINSGITSLKVSNYDNYRLEIDNLLPLIYAGL